jgi:hypothetical protein
MISEGVYWQALKYCCELKQRLNSEALFAVNYSYTLFP